MNFDDQGLGLRERKKQRMRELIAETALRLFIERGFEGVKVSEVARTAEVSEQTVFNYFPAKEDLVYWRLESYEEELLKSVGQRAPGESIPAAFRRFVWAQRGLLGQDDPSAVESLVSINHMIVQSPALLAREGRVFDRYTDALAAQIVEESAVEYVEAWVVANALVGAHRALVGFLRGQLQTGKRGPELRLQVEAQADRVFDILEQGLVKYGIR